MYVNCRSTSSLVDFVRDGGKAVGGGVYGEGSTMSPILLDEVDCMGTEMSLMECSHLGLGNHNCLHHEDAGVICQTDTSGYSQSPEVTQRQETTTPTDTSGMSEY